MMCMFEKRLLPLFHFLPTIIFSMLLPDHFLVFERPIFPGVVVLNHSNQEFDTTPLRAIVVAISMNPAGRG